MSKIYTYVDTLPLYKTPQSESGVDVSYKPYNEHLIRCLRVLHDNKLITKATWNSVVRKINYWPPDQTKLFGFAHSEYKHVIFKALQFIHARDGFSKAQFKLVCKKFEAWLTPEYYFVWTNF